MSDRILAGWQEMAEVVRMSKRNLQRFKAELEAARIIFPKRIPPRRKPYQCALESYLIGFMIRGGFCKKKIE